jgi:hypothetical protein
MSTQTEIAATGEKYTTHLKTQNMSFLKMYRYLRDRGIKNNKFFLRLYDESLATVNPHSARLTPVQKTKILAEITKNPYYYLREIVKIPIPGGLASFELHPGNLAITWALINNLDQIALLPRQRYKTVSIAATLTWVYDFGTKNTHMLFGNKSLGDSKNNLRRFKEIRENIPQFLRETINTPGLDVDNMESVKSEKTRNKIDTVGQPTNEDAADKQGYCMALYKYL